MIKLIDPIKFSLFSDEDQEEYLDTIKEWIEENEDEFIQEMEEIATQHLSEQSESFGLSTTNLDNFYVFDLYEILTSKKGTIFIWMLNETKTELIALDRIITFPIDLFDYDSYFIIKYGVIIKEISANQAERLLKNKMKLRRN